MKQFMTEKQKMLAGELYSPLDKELSEERLKARILFQEFNKMGDKDKPARDKVIHQLLDLKENDLWIEPPFFCDYGYNIHLGKNVFINFNCCILDVCSVTIGDNCMIAPNVQIYTATHPLEHQLRNSGKEFAKPISIGKNVWIGGGAVICPGINIGNGAVIAAGAVVTKNVTDNVLVGGNPARVIKSIDN